MSGSGEYFRIWPTWNLVPTGRRKETPGVTKGPGAENGVPWRPETTELRHRAQRARMEKRMSLVDLSERVPHSTVEMLADYERSGDPLPESVMKALLALLSLKA